MKTRTQCDKCVGQMKETGELCQTHTEQLIIYECGICDCYHPWNWDGDCRDDANRYAGYDDYAVRNGLNEDDIEVRSMDDRIKADEYTAFASDSAIKRFGPHA